MNIQFRLCLPNPTGTCSVPDELDNGTMEGYDAIEEIIADCVASMITVEWKFDDEPDEKYRLGSIATWSANAALCDVIRRLEEENAELKKRLKGDANQ